MSCQISNEGRRAELADFLTCAPYGNYCRSRGGPNSASCSQHSGTPPNIAAVDYGEEVAEDPKIRSRRPPYMVQFLSQSPKLIVVDRLGLGLVVRLVHRSL